MRILIALLVGSLLAIPLTEMPVNILRGGGNEQIDQDERDKKRLDELTETSGGTVVLPEQEVEE